MSGVTGKKNSTLKKQSVKEDKLLSTGVKAIKFWHEAQADGETSIPFGSLVMPADVAANGLSNPTSTEILAANLALFHTNVEVHSSLNQKLMEGLTYVVQNAQIKFVNGYVSTKDEVFVIVYKNDVITGTNVVDARPLTATDVLTAGDTDFNVGESFKTNAYPTAQMGEVIVFVDGIAQFRNVGNATAAPAADGNYEEVHAANGQGVIIRFNDVFAVDVNVVVISRNLIAERPDISMMQLIENLGGQLDAVISTVAALAGVPETDFQTAANQIDLRAFGDTVTTNRNNIAANVVEIATKHDQFQIDWQRKTSSISADQTGDIITFNNLNSGATYRATAYLYLVDIEASGESATFVLKNGGTNVSTPQIVANPGEANTKAIAVTDVFVANDATTTLTGTLTSNNYSSAGNMTIVLEELPNHVETSDWT